MVDDVEPAEIAKRLVSDPTGLLLLDVREPWERELAVIEPSLHIPMNDVAERSTELPKDREIVVYCHGGTRSAMVAAYLEHHGFSRVKNLSGGIEAWSVDVDSQVPRYR